jgi:branched-chain amino acid transport system permease protein
VGFRGIAVQGRDGKSTNGMSVLENIVVGAERPGNEVALGPTGVEQHALAVLDFVGLAENRKQTVQNLSYGHQRLAEIARALAGSPSCYSSMSRVPV